MVAMDLLPLNSQFEKSDSFGNLRLSPPTKKKPDLKGF